MSKDGGKVLNGNFKQYNIIIRMKQFDEQLYICVENKETSRGGQKSLTDNLSTKKTPSSKKFFTRQINCSIFLPKISAEL